MSMELHEVSQSRVNSIIGCRKIVWKIDNYFPGTCGETWTIQSPEFSVYSPKLTKWRLNLLRRAGPKYHFVWVSLERLNCDPFTGVVRVNWKLRYPIDDGGERITENRRMFTMNSKFEMKVPDIDLVERKVSKNKSFIVECYMIVFVDNNAEIRESCEDAGLKSLSQDLSKIAGGLHADAKFFMGSVDTFDVHRAIVCHRNRVFKELITDPDHLVFDLNYNKNWETVRKIVRFLYTGDLKHVLRLPSFELEEVIEHFDVEEIKEYYSYHELRMETKISTIEAQFEWKVTNLDKITEHCILGPNMQSLEKNKIFQLALYTEGIGATEKSIYLKVKFSNTQPTGHLCISIGLFDIYKNVHSIMYRRWFPGKGENIIFDEFAPIKILEDPLFVTKGMLTLFCRLERSTDVISEPVTETCPIIEKVDKHKHYAKLSQDLASLLDSGEYSDVRVVPGTEVTRVHKAIISCRSHVLKILLEDDRGTLYLPIFAPRILPLVFHYIYTGVLKPCNTMETLFVYDIANIIYVEALKNACSVILRGSFDISNAIDILEGADNHKDPELKRAAFRFIFSNVTEIQALPSWRRLINERAALYREWNKFLNSDDDLFIS